MYEDILESGGNLDNRQNDGNRQDRQDHSFIIQEWASTTIGPEIIEQMPIILVQSNKGWYQIPRPTQHFFKRSTKRPNK